MHETTIPTANGSTPSNDMRSAESVEVTEPLPVVDPVPEWPTVSIIIPVRNEMCHISECLDALLAQDYPRELMEVICVDGYSDDGTRAIVDEYIAGNPHLSLLDNPGRIVSPAMNAGISAAQGDIVIRIDARCIVEQDYVRQCVRTLQQTGAQNVGGPQVAVGLDSVQAQAIAVATTSPVGIGNSKFRYATEPQFVDTVYLGSYPRAVFRRIGLYDEQLLRNQDYELNHRLRKAGGKIYFTPLIRSVYYSRPTLRRLWRQYFQYGFWKVHTLRLHPDSLKWRQMVAPALVLSLVFGFVIGAIWGIWWPIVVVLAAYIAALVTGSLLALRHHSRRIFALLPLIFVILHLSWGFGFVWGILTMPFAPRSVPGSGY